MNQDARDTFDVRRGGEGRELLSEERLVASLAVRYAELQLVDESSASGEPERHGSLRIEEHLVIFGVSARLITPDAGDQQQPLVEGQEFLLKVESEILRPGAELVDREFCTSADVLLASHLFLRLHARTRQLAGFIGDTRRRREVRPTTRRRVGVNDVDVHVEVQVVRIGQQRRPREPIVILKLQIRREEKVILLLEPIHAALCQHLNPVVRSLDQVPVEAARPDKPVDILVVSHVGKRGQRIAALERIVGKRPVGPPTQIDDVRREREHHPRAHTSVVVVGQAAPRQGVYEV